MEEKTSKRKAALKMSIANAIPFRHQRSDVFITIGTIAIILIMLVPIPVWLLDICLVSMIGIAVMILIASLK